MSTKVVYNNRQEYFAILAALTVEGDLEPQAAAEHALTIWSAGNLVCIENEIEDRK